MKKVLFILLAFACGCSDSKEPQVHVEAPDGTVFTNNFIQAYRVPERLAGEAAADGYLRLAFDGRILRNTETDAAARAEYDLLSVKYGDTAFDGYLVPHSTEALGTVCTAIDIVCDKAFDEAHAAGASLGDLVKVCAVSFRKFVSEGYAPARAGEAFPAEFDGLGFYNGLGAAPLFAKLTELKPDDLTLIEPEFYLFFTKKPQAGRYVFSIAVRTENGDLKAEVPVEFK